MTPRVRRHLRLRSSDVFRRGDGWPHGPRVSRADAGGRLAVVLLLLAMLAAILGGVVSCSPTVNGAWLALHQTVQTCPSPTPAPLLGARPERVWE